MVENHRTSAGCRDDGFMKELTDVTTTFGWTKPWKTQHKGNDVWIHICVDFVPNACELIVTIDYYVSPLPWFLGFKLSRIHRFEIWRSFGFVSWGLGGSSRSLARCGFYGQKEEYDNDTMPLSVKVMLMEGIGCTGWTWTWCWKVVVDSADLFKPSCPKKSNALVLDFGHDILTRVDRLSALYIHRSLMIIVFIWGCIDICLLHPTGDLPTCNLL